MLSKDLRQCTPERALITLERAADRSTAMIETAKGVIDSFSKERGLNTSGICFVVVGSVGRKEALEASDFDFIPVTDSSANLEAYQPHDGLLRQALTDRLKAKVSRGEDLTKGISLGELTEADSIGGFNDCSAALTKRILILTESQQVSGGLGIETTRRRILEAYAKEERTSGRHVLSLCNDIARYHKTLCIEYKAKIDEAQKDWCTRNMKLRHSRKLWYFSTILSFIKVSEAHPLGSADYVDALLHVFNDPPVERITSALSNLQPIELGRVLENYAIFLQFMSNLENRHALAAVEHDKRYEMELGNPFPTLKFNSDLMHRNMTAILDGLSASMRDRIISWFLL